MPLTEASIGMTVQRPGAWRALRWSLPFFAALLPIILLGFFSYQVASESVEDLVESENLVATATVSQMVMQEFSRTADIGHAIASFKGSIDRIRERDDIGMRERLRAIVLAYPHIDRVLISSTGGLLWTDFPQVPEAVFSPDQKNTDWYKGLSQRWKPYISNVYVRQHDPLNPVVAIALPVYDDAGTTIAALVFEYKTRQIQEWLENIQIGNTGRIFIVDHNGTTVAHPKVEHNGELHREYAEVEAIIRAREENVFETMEYDDPMMGERMLASFQPLAIGINRWIVVAQQPVSKAYAHLDRVRLNIGLAAGVLTLFTLVMVVSLALMTHRNELLNKALANKNQTLQDITSFVSHQLRAPVTAMRWTIESIMDGDEGEVSEKIKTSLEGLRDVAIQNGKLIDDILNISRIDRGVIEVQTEAVSLQEIAERALRDYRVALEKAGLSLTLEGMDEPIKVLADKEKMAESITNAISNAIKHTKKGGITLKIRSDASFGYIDVIDTGEGMPPDVVKNLFSRTGIKGKNTDSSQSTGLGLFIARNFMQLQKGDIEVSAIPGKGSTFTYKIPLAHVSEASHS